MGEAVAAVAAAGLEELGSDRLLEGTVKLGAVDVRDPRQGLFVEVPPDRRGATQDHVGLLRETVKPAADDVTDALRDQHPAVSAPVEGALAGQQADDLPDEERVPLGLPVDLGDQSGRRGGPGRALDVAGYLRLP